MTKTLDELAKKILEAPRTKVIGPPIAPKQTTAIADPPDAPPRIVYGGPRSARCT